MRKIIFYLNNMCNVLQFHKFPNPKIEWILGNKKNNE